MKRLDIHLVLCLAGLLAWGARGQAQSSGPCEAETTYTYHETTYDLVELSGQCWFADDLKTKNLNSGIPLSQGNPLFDPSNPWVVPRSYGYIEDSDGTNYYDYFSLTSDILCPKGWHVPTIDDANNAKDDAGFGTAFVSSEGGAFDTDYNASFTGSWGIATSPGYGQVTSFDTFGSISPGSSDFGGAKTRCVKD